MINDLDGLTILRFAHAYRSGGGIEQYINDLDNILLKRNKAKVIRMYLEKESKDGKRTTEEIGQGCLVEIPLTVNAGAILSNSHEHKFKPSKINSLLKVIRAIFRELIIYNPFLYHTFFCRILRRYYPHSGYFEARNAGEVAKRIFQEYNIDLLLMHHIGGIDSAEIIEEAKKQGIPYIFINHFRNLRFTNISVREQIGDAACIAGVTDVGLPKRLRNHFHKVSDGIDMEIFDPARARPIGLETDNPIIIYPARITWIKGQKDLIKAYAKLKSEGLRAKIVFAGRTDSSEYVEELKGLTKKNGLTDDVLFVGLLNREELRDWYGISSVMAFPTYLGEGLPRILMESQAMKVPPVAYIIGGTPGALQDGKTGFLVRKGDIRKFTQRLRELLTNEKKRRKMGEDARMFAQKEFSLEAFAKRHEKLYLNVLKK